MNDPENIDKVADLAVARYEGLHRETSRAPEKPGPGDFNAELEQIWAAIRRIDNGGAGGGGAIEHPFQISDASAAGTPKIRVRFGTVNDYTPTSIATDLTLTDDATNSIYLDLSVDDDASATITAVAVATATTGKPDDSDSHAYILLGTVVAASGEVAINQAVTHSLRFNACDRVAADPEADPVVEFARGTYNFWGI